MIYLDSIFLNTFFSSVVHEAYTFVLNKENNKKVNIMINDKLMNYYHEWKLKMNIKFIIINYKCLIYNTY